MSQHGSSPHHDRLLTASGWPSKKARAIIVLVSHRHSLTAIASTAHCGEADVILRAPPDPCRSARQTQANVACRGTGGQRAGTERWFAMTIWPRRFASGSLQRRLSRRAPRAMHSGRLGWPIDAPRCRGHDVTCRTLRRLKTRHAGALGFESRLRPIWGKALLNCPRARWWSPTMAASSKRGRTCRAGFSLVEPGAEEDEFTPGRHEHDDPARAFARPLPLGQKPVMALVRARCCLIERGSHRGLRHQALATIPTGVGGWRRASAGSPPWPTRKQAPPRV
jgi:hypothetical protein